MSNKNRIIPWTGEGVGGGWGDSCLDYRKVRITFSILTQGTAFV